MRCILSIVTPLQLTLLIRKRKRYTIWISEMRRIAYKKMQKRSSSVDTMVLPRSMRPLKIFKKLKKNNGMLYFSRHSHGEWDSPVWAVTGRVDFGVVIESESGVQPAAAGHACATGTSSTKAAWRSLILLLSTCASRKLFGSEGVAGMVDRVVTWPLPAHHDGWIGTLVSRVSSHWSYQWATMTAQPKPRVQKKLHPGPTFKF